MCLINLYNFKTFIVFGVCFYVMNYFENVEFEGYKDQILYFIHVIFKPHAPLTVYSNVCIHHFIKFVIPINITLLIMYF